jgi:hypothetical protein
MCLRCACGAIDVPVMPVMVPVGFLEGLFFRFSIPLGKYQNFKAHQIIHMHLNGLQRPYNVTTDQAWCACGAFDVPVMPVMVPVGFLDWLFFVFQFHDNMSTFKSPSNHSCASEWPSNIVWCHYRSCLMCLWCACGAYDVPVMPVMVPVGFLWIDFFSFSNFIDNISTFKNP